MDLGDLQKQISTGHAAARIMADPTFVEAVKAVEEQLFLQWSQASFEEDQKHIHATMRGMREFLRMLKAMIDSGKVSASIADKRH